ncbi:Major facilitator superfamily [Lasiodiplodia theobromae]|uniref:MFS transporter n=1 Tax=Lasiodiplodia theobromae TaxID=45133 RepID=UPI0015C3F9D1|nr:MFS transporter [Lasiodiplodia theobromae]KAF4543793.1 MFS transporter [Lasiodiplodia theobromae]KAF9631531.1 Major facilitator superfamily [Lasiodiplodia theobromae]
MVSDSKQDVEAHSVQDDDKIKAAVAKGDGDEALKFLAAEATNAGELSDVIDEKALVRKIDWMIIPLMWCCYCLQYLDKTLINYAAVMGLYEDAAINTDQFSTLAWIFYASYLAFEFPHGYAMQRLPTAKYLGAMVTLWGVAVAATAACKTYGTLVATRVLLGVFESAVAPALILVTGMWYKKRDEQPWRVGLWYLGTGVGTVIGALVSFGFQHYSSPTFNSWQIMFLVVGLVTVAVGVLVVLLLPDNPMTCARLTHAEKLWAVERLRVNQTGIENVRFKPAQARECFADPQTWMIALATVASNIPNAATSSFQATIIKGFGYDSKTTALLSIPAGAVIIVSILLATYTANRFNQRSPPAIVTQITGVLGGCLIAFLPADNKVGRLIGIYIMNGIVAGLPLMYAYVSANVAGHTKKVTMNAVLLISFCLGNIIGPLTFRDGDKPEYMPAKIAIIVADVFSIIVVVILRFYYIWENRRRDRLAISHRENVEFLDLTDKENLEFRYSL